MGLWNQGVVPRASHSISSKEMMKESGVREVGYGELMGDEYLKLASRQSLSRNVVMKEKRT